MKRKRLIRIILSLSIVAMAACSSLTQKPAESAKPGGSPITIKGKIDYMKALGGYFVHGEEPGGEFFIMNENPKVLEGLFKSGKTVIIEGRIVRGAEYLFIEKIDGNTYRGVETPASK